MTGGNSRNILCSARVSQASCIRLAQIKGAPESQLDGTRTMNSKTSVPLGNVVRFPSPEHRQDVPASNTIAQDNWDHGPSPEESLRIMRAFVGIKNRKVRADLIEMLEGASRARGQSSGSIISSNKTPSKD
jgi:hypothetical protein